MLAKIAPRKPGRPPVDPEIKLSAGVFTRLTEADLVVVDAAAGRVGVNRSTWLRAQVIRAAATSHTPRKN